MMGRKNHYLDPTWYAPASVCRSWGYMEGCGLHPQEVFDAVKNAKGKVLVSYNDCPEVRKVFCCHGGFKCKTISNTYNMGKEKREGNMDKQVRELLITNHSTSRV